MKAPTLCACGGWAGALLCALDSVMHRLGIERGPLCDAHDRHIQSAN